MFNLIKDDFDENTEDIMKSINKILSQSEEESQENIGNKENNNNDENK